MAHLITSGELQKMTGYSRRQLARFAPSLPGAVKRNGWHWEYPDTPALRRWIEIKSVERATKARIKIPKRKKLAKGDFVFHPSPMAIVVGAGQRFVGSFNNFLVFNPIRTFSDSELRLWENSLKASLNPYKAVLDEIARRKELSAMAHVSG